ncbi:hypothetical protein AAVH_40391, partial [Aphelenchoides avenae]
NTNGALAFIRRVASRPGTHWEITIKGHPEHVRDTIESLSRAAPVYHEVTGDQRKWIAFPNERARKFGSETDTFVSVERDGAQGGDCQVIIYGTEVNVKQACAKL